MTIQALQLWLRRKTGARAISRLVVYAKSGSVNWRKAGPCNVNTGTTKVIADIKHHTVLYRDIKNCNY